MRFYNTLTKKKEEFTTIEPNRVKLYVCGPTVYNYVHVGNARPYVVFDALRRYLEYKGYDVSLVANFTDIDDRIIARAIDEGVDFKQVAEKFIGEARKDEEGLGLLPPTFNPKATEEIEGIIQMIATLVEKGYAYVKNGSVFYNTARFPEYGKLSGKRQEELEAGARIEVDKEKETPFDFVLWKPNKPGEPYWDSPWGTGRPGWHIECSAMAKKYLGDQIDIHAGGEDLMFPHHENEIAQSEAANGKPFARFWLHNALLNVNGQKMSKSRGNFFTIREIVQQFSYEVLRFFLLSAHYRSPLNFSAELMQAAESGYSRILTCADNLLFLAENASGGLTSEETELLEKLPEFYKEYEGFLEDDFNTASAISVIFDLVKFANVSVGPSSSKDFCLKLYEAIEKLTSLLGIPLAKKESLDSKIEAMIEERQAARKAKDYATADKIRNELSTMGIILEDTAVGVRWSYKSE